MVEIGAENKTFPEYPVVPQAGRLVKKVVVQCRAQGIGYNVIIRSGRYRKIYFFADIAAYLTLRRGARDVHSVHCHSWMEVHTCVT